MALLSLPKSSKSSSSPSPKKKTSSTKKTISSTGGTVKKVKVVSGVSGKKSARGTTVSKKTPRSSRGDSSPSKRDSMEENASAAAAALANANPETIRELKQVFRLFDKDGDNSITINELRGVLQSLNVACEDDELDAMMKHVDTNGDAQISFEEFFALMTEKSMQTGRDEEMEAREAFKIFDRSGTGKITPQDLYIVMKNLGEEGLTMEDVEELIRDADADSDGCIDFDAFREMMKRDE